MKSETHRNGRLLLQRHRPVLAKSGWLPAELWPELDEVREAHEEAVARREQAQADARELGRRFEQEDKERIQAYKTGLEAPKMTDPAERERATADAKAKAQAAEEALQEAVANAVSVLEDRSEEWLTDLRGRAAKVQEKREEARRQLAEVDREQAEIARIQHWVERSVRPQGLPHIAIDKLPLKVKPSEADERSPLTVGTVMY